MEDFDWVKFAVRFVAGAGVGAVAGVLMVLGEVFGPEFSLGWLLIAGSAAACGVATGIWGGKFIRFITDFF